MLTLVFVDQSGAPLTPESVTIVEEETPTAPALNDLRPCGTAFATCEGNRLTVDLNGRTRVPDGSARILARATTGEIFEGDVSPTWAQSPLPDGICECSGSLATFEVTLTAP